MTKPVIPDSVSLGIDFYWLLYIIAQLPAFEFDIPIAGSEDKLRITFDLEVVK